MLFMIMRFSFYDVNLHSQYNVGVLFVWISTSVKTCATVSISSEMDV